MDLSRRHQTWGTVMTAIAFLMLMIATGTTASDNGASPVYFDPNNMFSKAESDFPSLTSVEYATRTVYGFLDFTTTMGNTVMIFKPGSEPDSTVEPETTKITPTKTSNVVTHVETATPEIVLASEARIELSSSHDEEIPSLLPEAAEINIHNLFDVKSTVGLEGLFSGFDLDSLPPKKKPVVKERVESRVEENVSLPKSIAPAKLEMPVSKSPESSTRVVVESSVHIAQEPVVSVASEELTFSAKKSLITPKKPESILPASPVFVDDESILTPVPNALVKEHYDFYSVAPRLSVENSFRSEERVIAPSKPNKVDVKSKVDVRVEVSDGKSRRKLESSLPVPNLINPPSPEKSAPSTSKKASPAPIVESTPVIEPSIDRNQPLGLITTLGGTTVMTGTTTVHETRVIGTYLDGQYAQILQSTSHIFFDNDEYFDSPNPGTGDIAVVDDVKTVQSVITGSHTTVITPVLEGTIEPDFYNFRSRAPALEVDYDNYEVETNDESFGRSIRPSIVSAPMTEQATAFRHHGHGDSEVSSKRVAAASSTKRNNAQEDLLSRLRKNKEKFERLTAEPSIQKTERRPFNPKGSGSGNARAINGNGRQDATVATLYAYAEPLKAPAEVDSGRPGITRRRQTRYRKKIGPARPVDSRQQQRLEAETSSVIRTTPRPSFNNRPRNNGNVHLAKSGNRAKTVKIEPTASSSIYKFKLNRPSGRWRWQSGDRPKVVIKQNVQASSPNYDEQGQSGDYEVATEGREENRTDPQPDYYNDNDEELQVLEPSLPELETIRVEMSTPEPFENIYYEIATIRSPYVFNVGQTKNTRYITLTSTIERFIDRRGDAPDIDPSLPTEEIGATRPPSFHENLIEDNEIMTLPPIGLAGNIDLPPLETKIESYSTTELMLKTTLLPVIKPDGTSYHTLTQSYYITRVVTALKTMPPMNAYKFAPNDDLIDFNDHLSLSGSENEARLVTDGNGVQVALPPDFFDDQDLVLAGARFDPQDMERKLHPEDFREFETRRIAPTPTVQASPKTDEPAQDPNQLQHLAYLKFLNPYLNVGGANAVAKHVITNTIPVVKTETLYKTDILPIWDGVTTHYSTFTHPIGTRVKTEYNYVTTELPGGTPPIPPVPYPNPLNPFQQQMAPFAATVSSHPVTFSTRVTSTSLKVYKITLQAKPILTTITSTRVYDTVLTTYSTATVPSPGAGMPYLPFPGYFG